MLSTYLADGKIVQCAAGVFCLLPFLVPDISPPENDGQIMKKRGEGGLHASPRTW